MFRSRVVLSILAMLYGTCPAWSFMDLYQFPQEEAAGPVEASVPAPDGPAPLFPDNPVIAPTANGFGSGIPALGHVGEDVTRAPAPPGQRMLSGPDRAVCIAAITAAERKFGIPENLLLAIGLQESGMRRDGQLTIWPWVVNSHGSGHMFETRPAAEAFVASERAAGRTLVDVGCMQVNLRWHPEAFRRIEDGFDPTLNADYAASFLRDLYEQSGDWMTAAGNYHSTTPEFHHRYLQGVRRNLEVAMSNRTAFEKLASQVASHEKNTVAGTSVFGENRSVRISNLRPGGYRRQMERLARLDGPSPHLPDIPAMASPVADEERLAGAWWASELSSDDEGGKSRSIYSRQDLEPVLPQLIQGPSSDGSGAGEQ